MHKRAHISMLALVCSYSVHVCLCIFAYVLLSICTGFTVYMIYKHMLCVYRCVVFACVEVCQYSVCEVHVLLTNQAISL